MFEEDEWRNWLKLPTSDNRAHIAQLHRYWTSHTYTIYFVYKTIEIWRSFRQFPFSFSFQGPDWICCMTQMLIEWALSHNSFHNYPKNKPISFKSIVLSSMRLKNLMLSNNNFVGSGGTYPGKLSWYGGIQEHVGLCNQPHNPHCALGCKRRAL